MGMGYSAAYADVVTEDFVKEMAPMEFENFIASLAKIDFSLEKFAMEKGFGGNEDWGDEVDQTYDALYDAFKAATGLGLSVEYHNAEDEGSRYDEVDGVFWEVTGVYMLTEAGTKYRDEIIRKHYVEFG